MWVDLTVVSVISLIELGVLASGMNYIIFSKLIQTWGSTMTSLNTYLQPIVGILLGVIILNENISTKGWVAIGMLFSGVLMFGLSRTVLQSLRAKALKGSFGGSGNT